MTTLCVRKRSTASIQLALTQENKGKLVKLKYDSLYLKA